MTTVGPTTAGTRATIVGITPLLLLVAFAWHPYIPGRLPNDTAIADAVAADTLRWGLSHLAAAIAFGFVVIAFIAIRTYLSQPGAEPWSALGLPFVVIGSALYAMLPGMELAPLAAVESGGDPAAIQAALQPWFIPILLTGGIAFALGTLGFATGIVRSGVLSRGTAWLVAGGLVVMAASRLVPLVAVQLYVQGLAALVALLPLAYQMWMQSRTAAWARPVPAA